MRQGVIIWGNHSSTQYPDVRHATVGGKQVLNTLPRDWLEADFVTTVQKRGAAIIAARKLSSAASAAKAICDHMRDWSQASARAARRGDRTGTRDVSDPSLALAPSPEPSLTLSLTLSPDS